MIYFPPLRTERLNVQLRELTIEEAVQAAAIPPELHEQCTTFILQAATDGEHDVLAMTVQERTLLITHYIAATLGDPDFEVADAKLSHYLDSETSAAPDEVPIGEIAGSVWHCRQINGYMAEALEMVAGDLFVGVQPIVVAAEIAMRIREDGEQDRPPPDPADRHAYAEWLVHRTKNVVLRMPESLFEGLLFGMEEAKAQLHHLFAPRIVADGIVVDPISSEGPGRAVAPARFLARTALGGVALALGSQPD